jgi:hypothetical protein
MNSGIHMMRPLFLLLFSAIFLVSCATGGKKIAEEVKLKDGLYFAFISQPGIVEMSYFIDVKDERAYLEKYSIVNEDEARMEKDTLAYVYDNPPYYEGRRNKIRYIDDAFYINGEEVKFDPVIDKELCGRFCSFWHKDYYSFDIARKRSICRNAHYVWKKWEANSEQWNDHSFFRIVNAVDITLPNDEFKKRVDVIAEDLVAR